MILSDFRQRNRKNSASKSTPKKRKLRTQSLSSDITSPDEACANATTPSTGESATPDATNAKQFKFPKTKKVSYKSYSTALPSVFKKRNDLLSIVE